jgi:ribonucleoside-diphosphate reductase alpha chain
MLRAPHEWIVRKRDGRSVSFEVARIQNAISNAFRAELNLAEGQPLEADVLADVTSVVQSVSNDVAALASQPAGVDVEKIQDLVEWA